MCIKVEGNCVYNVGNQSTISEVFLPEYQKKGFNSFLVVSIFNHCEICYLYKFYVTGIVRFSNSGAFSLKNFNYYAEIYWSP